jgi:hypothetical protein
MPLTAVSQPVKCPKCESMLIRSGGFSSSERYYPEFIDDKGENILMMGIVLWRNGPAENAIMNGLSEP